MNLPLHGSCLCGAIRYQLKAQPKAVTHCHCSQCRKGHGAAFASYGSVIDTDLCLLSGAELLTSYASSAGVKRQFCARCGSSLFWSRATGEYSDWISIALGTLDSPFKPDKQKHIHADSQATWFCTDSERA